MVKFSLKYARKCQTCQFHANLIHRPLEPLHPYCFFVFKPYRLDVVGFGTYFFNGACLCNRSHGLPLQRSEAYHFKKWRKNIAHLIVWFSIYIISDNRKQVYKIFSDGLYSRFGFKNTIRQYILLLLMVMQRL